MVRPAGKNYLTDLGWDLSDNFDRSWGSLLILV